MCMITVLLFWGQVAGHAGLFSDAGDLFRLYQMLLDEGTFNEQRYLKSKTIKTFLHPITAALAGEVMVLTNLKKIMLQEISPTRQRKCPWKRLVIQAGQELVYGLIRNLRSFIFFCQTVCNPRVNNGKLSELSIRGKIQDAIYKALGI